MQSLGAAFDELGLNFNGLASGVNVNVNINFVLDECSQGAWDFCIPNGEPFLINNDSGVSEQSVELGAGKQSITVKLRLDNVKQVGNPKDWGDYFHAKLIIYAMQKGGDIVYQSQDPKIGIGGTRT